jgi:hypothetical protein
VFRPDTAVTRENTGPQESHDTPGRRTDELLPTARRDRRERLVDDSSAGLGSR